MRNVIFTTCFMQMLATVAFSCPKYTVYYIPLKDQFYVPPLPIENHARKTFEIESCKIEALFNSATSSKPGATVQPNGFRTKIVSVKYKTFIYIDEMRKVIFEGNTRLIPTSVFENALHEIENTAKTISSKK